MFRIFNRAKPYLDLSSDAFAAEIEKNKDTVIVDVRTPMEYRIGKIPGAINMDITRGDFESWVAELDKDKTYLIYCRGGNRSIAACMIFGSNGLRSCNLKGGVHTWKGQMDGMV